MPQKHVESKQESQWRAGILCIDIKYLNVQLWVVFTHPRRIKQISGGDLSHQRNTGWDTLKHLFWI